MPRNLRKLSTFSLLFYMKESVELLASRQGNIPMFNRWKLRYRCFCAILLSIIWTWRVCFLLTEQGLCICAFLQDWPCKLSVQQHFETSENIIIQAKLEEVEKMYNQSLSQDLLKREKVKMACNRSQCLLYYAASVLVVSNPMLHLIGMSDRMHRSL